MNNIILECNDLCLSYDRIEVVSKLNMKLEEGSYLCVLGENGTGKSTLLKGLLQLKKASSGSIKFADGISLRDIGYLPQQSEIQRDFPANVWEIVLSGCVSRLAGRFFFGKNEKKRAKEYMQMLGIYDLSKRSYRQLSGGQQQRVLLARALCAGDKMLVLDEPASNLDPIMTDEMYEIINDLNKKYKMTIVMVSHDVIPAVKHASHVLHLSNHGSYFAKVEDYLQSDIAKLFIKREEEFSK